jgi:Flp pilus assembly protein TadG
VNGAASSERGSVVAEFAVALPAVLLVLATAIGGVQLSSLQLRVQDAAADAARAIARGESGGTVASRLARQVPGANLRRTSSGDLLCVQVSASASGPIGRLGLRVAARSCALSGGR